MIKLKIMLEGEDYMNNIERIKKEFDGEIKTLSNWYITWIRDHLNEIKPEDITKPEALLALSGEVPLYFKRYELRFGSFEDFAAELTKRCLNGLLYWKYHEEEEARLCERYSENIASLTGMEKSALISSNTDDITNMIAAKAAEKLIVLIKKEITV